MSVQWSERISEVDREFSEYFWTPDEPDTPTFAEIPSGPTSIMAVVVMAVFFWTPVILYFWRTR